MTKSIKRRSQR